MQCENCNKRPAQIHLTQIVDNKVSTVHLCEECANDKGVQTGSAQTNLPLTDFIASIGVGAASALPADTPDSGRCDECGSSMRDFRATGRLGCPSCYDSFNDELRDLLRRLHGANKHVGRNYTNPGAEHDNKSSQLADLKSQLKMAIEAENFELAAELRDRIQVLGIEHD